MQMVGICVCFAYADARHMDMLHLCWFLTFPAQIRKIPKSDPEPRGRQASPPSYHRRKGMKKPPGRLLYAADRGSGGGAGQPGRKSDEKETDQGISDSRQPAVAFQAAQQKGTTANKETKNLNSHVCSVNHQFATSVTFTTFNNQLSTLHLRVAWLNRRNRVQRIPLSRSLSRHYQ